MFLAHFGSIYPIFGAKKIFVENPALAHTTSNGFLAPCQNLEKVNGTIQRKCPNRRTEGQKDGQTLFYRTLPATAAGPIKWLVLKEETLNNNILLDIYHSITKPPNPR